MVTVVKPVQNKYASQNNRPYRTTSCREPGYDVKPGNIQCYRCGSSMHIASSSSCPAVGKRCAKCRTVGHFAKVCRSGQKSKVNLVLEKDPNYCGPDEPVLYVSVHEYDVPVTPQPFECFGVGEASIQLLVDSGSKITIISRNTYTFSGLSLPLAPPDVNPGSYNGDRINLEGVIETNVCFKDRCV